MQQLIYLQIENGECPIVVTDIPNPVQPMVHIDFDGEYQNIFLRDPESGDWIEQDLGFTALAKMVGIKLDTLYYPDPDNLKELTWHTACDGKDIFRFGLCAEHSGHEEFFEVFAANRRYMFTLVKHPTGQWYFYKQPGAGGWDFDLRYYEKVPAFIDEHHLSAR